MLELRNLCFGVETEDSTKDIIKDVSFVVPDDKFVVITGPNGGGKSTLARLIMGIAKPSSGQILFNGEDITHMGITERANLGISFALQQPVRFKGIHVVDLLRLAAKRDLTVGEACDYLSAVGLCARDYIDREVNASLSGGELKRIEIATVLARGTALSVFDEPEAGIDLWSFARLTETFEQIHNSDSATMIIISHQERIISLADEVIVVGEGVIRHRGPAEAILPQILADTLGGCPVLTKGGPAL